MDVSHTMRAPECDWEMALLRILQPGIESGRCEMSLIVVGVGQGWVVDVVILLFGLSLLVLFFSLCVCTTWMRYGI